MIAKLVKPRSSLIEKSVSNTNVRPDEEVKTKIDEKISLMMRPNYSLKEKKI